MGLPITDGFEIVGRSVRVPYFNSFVLNSDPDTLIIESWTSVKSLVGSMMHKQKGKTLKILRRQHS